jgi:predicted acetyltransferase
MRFVLPTIEHEHSAVEFIKELHDHSSETNGDGGLAYFLENSTYKDWLIKIAKDRDLANIPINRVPQYTYFYSREGDDKIVGIISFRLALNDFLRREGGHIGYSIRPTEREKGYGTAMLRETLAVCGSIGLCNVIICCDKTNLASAGVIKHCGGILDAEFYSETFKAVVQRYKITLQADTPLTL